MTEVLIIVPARYGSTRLPGKPLLAETGKPLIQHTVEAASNVPDARIVVATDDERIFTSVKAFGGEVVMTSPDHASGSDRVAEAARLVGGDPKIIVNVQGDEPEINPDNIATLISTHKAAQRGARPAFVSTLVAPLEDDAAAIDPNTVKAVLSAPDPDGVRSALYFSRARLPYPRNAGPHPLLHLGIYAYTAETLQQFPKMAQTPLEQAEGLEQLRVLEQGHRIAVAEVDTAPPGIDTPEDYRKFVKRMG
ncbi:MAG: 3-deoxy-manno-octulosonate cytidylyltransferase [Parvularcula sp.]